MVSLTSSPTTPNPTGPHPATLPSRKARSSSRTGRWLINPGGPPFRRCVYGVWRLGDQRVHVFYLLFLETPALLFHRPPPLFFLQSHTTGPDSYYSNLPTPNNPSPPPLHFQLNSPFKSHHLDTASTSQIPSPPLLAPTKHSYAPSPRLNLSAAERAQHDAARAISTSCISSK